ncbi:MAG: hypothetical protein ABSE91_03715 [Patescibacteria group bacterium]|jgi:hypothetical protein
MNTQPVPLAKELEPDATESTTESSQNSETKVHFGQELGDFLAAAEESYAQAGDLEKAAEIRQAKEQLTKPNLHSAALAEVYIYAQAWEAEMKMQELLREQGQKDETERASENYYGSRRIFMENSQAIFPYIPEIARENIGSELKGMENLLVTSCPDVNLSRLASVRIRERTTGLEEKLASNLGEVLNLVDDISAAVSLSVEEALKTHAREMTVEFQAQLNICVMEMYRLQLLRDNLEKDIRRGQSAAPEPAEVTPVETVATAEKKSPLDIKKEAEENWVRLKLSEQFKMSLDDWIDQGLARDPDIETFGNDLDKWRAFDTAMRDLRYWYQDFSPEEKPTHRGELMEKLNNVFIQF